MVTRRPLELRLVKTKPGTENTPYAVFQGEEKHYNDFNSVRLRIERLTDDLCGTNKGIVDKPIILKVYDENCSDLTVIDLPGITRIPIGN